MANQKQKYPTIRISAKTHQTVKELAEQDQISMADVVEKAIENLRRERIARHANEVWAEAMKDPELREYWKNEDQEIELAFWSPVADPEENERE
jgi:hypothetical protein